MIDPKHLWLPLTLVLLGLLFHWPSLQIGFVSDDFILLEMVRERDWGWLTPFPAGSQNYWRPLVLATLDWMPSNSPLPHHLVNLALHLGCVLWLYGCIKNLGVGSETAWLAAAYFNIHLANVTNIYWIAGRTDSLCSFFFFAGLWFFLRLLKRPGWPGLIACLIAYGLALLSKENAIVFFPVCLGFFLLQSRFEALPGKRLAKMALGLIFLISCAYGLLLWLYFYRLPAGPLILNHPIALLENAAKNGLILISPFSTYWLKKQGVALLGLFAISFLMGLVYWLYRFRPVLSQRQQWTGLLLVVLTGGAMAPSLMFLHGVGPRLLYLPLGLFTILLAGFLHRYRRFCRYFFLVSLFFMAVATVNEARIWQQNWLLAKRCSDDFSDAMKAFPPDQPLVILGAPAMRWERPVFSNDMNHAFFFATYGRFGRFINGSAVGQIGWSGGPLNIQSVPRTQPGHFQRHIQGSSSYLYGIETGVGDKYVYGAGETTVLTLRKPGEVTQFQFRFLAEFLARQPLVFEFDGMTMVRTQ